jgi:hypothetical protein
VGGLVGRKVRGDLKMRAESRKGLYLIVVMIWWKREE